MSRILVISPSWLGDIVMMQSLLKVLKKQDERNIIDVYAPEYSLPILKRMEEINDILINPFAHGSFDLKKRFLEGRRLKKYGYDTCFVLPNSMKSALIALFASIKDRRGFKGESRYFVLNNIRCNKQDYPRMVDRYVALAFPKDKVKNSADLPEFDYPALTVQAPSDKLLNRLGIKSSRPLMALGCGANYGPAKLWPVEYFAEVSHWWISHGGAVLALGTKQDGKTVEAIKQHLSCNEDLTFFHDVAGQTSIEEALDLTAFCKAAVCNDSGLMHTCAAASVPQIDIFGSTSTVYTPPLSKIAVCIESDESCHPCFKRTCKYGTYSCLKKIQPQKVIEKLKELIHAI